MPLYYCPDCANPTSDKATACPKCGCPNPYMQVQPQTQQPTESITTSKVKCPRCDGYHTQFYQQEVVGRKSKMRTSFNLNPLHPFTVFNTKEVVKNAGTKKDMWVCNDCGYIFERKENKRFNWNEASLLALVPMFCLLFAIIDIAYNNSSNQSDTYEKTTAITKEVENNNSLEVKSIGEKTWGNRDAQFRIHNCDYVEENNDYIKIECEYVNKSYNTVMPNLLLQIKAKQDGEFLNQDYSYDAAGLTQKVPHNKSGYFTVAYKLENKSSPVSIYLISSDKKEYLVATFNQE